MGSHSHTIRALLSLGGASGVTFGLFLLMTHLLPENDLALQPSAPRAIHFGSYLQTDAPRIKRRPIAPKLAPARKPPGIPRLKIPDLRISAAAQLRVTPPLHQRTILPKLVTPDSLPVPGLGRDYIHAEGLIARILMPPMYPPKGLSRGLSGEVTVEFTVNAQGIVVAAHIVAAEPENIFDDVTLQAVAHWRFQPVIVDGKPSSITARQTINFNLAEEELE